MLGILIGLTPITQFFSSPILGKISDAKGRKYILIYGTLIGCIGYCFAILGLTLNSLFLLFVYRILIGLSGGTIAVAQAVIVDISTKATKARRFALFNASVGTGFAIGPFLGGKLADTSVASWCCPSLPFIAAGVMSFINFILILMRFPETRKIQKDSPMHLLDSILKIRKVFLWRGLRGLFFAAFIFSFGWSFFNEFIPLFLRMHFAFSPSEIGNYYACGGAWYALCTGVLTAPILKRFSPEKVVMKALIGCAICMSIYLAIPKADFIWWILPCLMYCLSVTYPTTSALVSNQVTQNNQGEVLGVYQSVVASAMGISPFIAGSFVGMYPELTIWAGALCMLLASFTLWKSRRKSLISVP